MGNELLFHMNRSIRLHLSKYIKDEEERTNSDLTAFTRAESKERFIQAEHRNCMWQIGVMTVAPSQATVSSEYIYFAGLELPGVHMKLFTEKWSGV